MSKKLTLICTFVFVLLIKQAYSFHPARETEEEIGDKRGFRTLNDTFDGDEEDKEPPIKKARVVLPQLSMEEGWKAVEALSHSKQELASGGNKDRYSNVTPFEFNRFKYSSDNERYINASWVKFDNCQQTFIQSQAPLLNTIADQWEMIWQSGAATTVMLSNFLEGRQVKAQCYWPVEEGESEKILDNLNVHLLKKEEIFEEGILKAVRLDFRIERGTETKNHTIIHYKLWPDQGVLTTAKILELYKLVKNIHLDKKHPIIVHCSAGVGRAGTFVSLYSLLSAFEEGTTGDPSQQVLELRKQRAHSVQNKGQYNLIYEAFNQFITPITYLKNK